MSKDALHPHNRFRELYDFAELCECSSALASFVRPNAYGAASIDYADPMAVKALNQALLLHGYGLKMWDIPDGYLCPPIPGRSDYIHHLADLIGHSAERTILDVGTGANCIYPLIGASEYRWRFVATDIDPVAVRWAQKLIAANPSVAGRIECRLQRTATECFRGVVTPAEYFDATMCNPPFHASAVEAAAGARRKATNLGTKKSVLNFGGTSGELWCDGGEIAFLRRMIAQSVECAERCGWFTTLVSKSDNLPSLQKALKAAKAADVKVIEMAQGQKKSRILAWTFQR